MVRVGGKNKKNYDIEDESLDEMKRDYDKVANLSLKEIGEKHDMVCDQRSWSMADKSMRLTKAQNAEVALVRIGASHVGGFIQRLRETGSNYLVYSPSYSIDEAK